MYVTFNGLVSSVYLITDGWGGLMQLQSFSVGAVKS